MDLEAIIMEDNLLLMEAEAVEVFMEVEQVVTCHQAKSAAVEVDPATIHF